MSDLTPTNSTDLLPGHPSEWRNLSGLGETTAVNPGSGDDVVIRRLTQPAVPERQKTYRVAELRASDRQLLARRLASEFEFDTVRRLAGTYSLDVAELAMVFKEMVRKFGYPPRVPPTAGQVLEFLDMA